MLLSYRGALLLSAALYVYDCNCYCFLSLLLHFESICAQSVPALTVKSIFSSSSSLFFSAQQRHANVICHLNECAHLRYRSCVLFSCFMRLLVAFVFFSNRIENKLFDIKFIYISILLSYYRIVTTVLHVLLNI